jgi:hypothetical protein
MEQDNLAERIGQLLYVGNQLIRSIWGRISPRRQRLDGLRRRLPDFVSPNDIDANIPCNATQPASHRVHRTQFMQSSNSAHKRFLSGIFSVRLRYQLRLTQRVNSSIPDGDVQLVIAFVSKDFQVGPIAQRNMLAMSGTSTPLVSRLRLD